MRGIRRIVVSPLYTSAPGKLPVSPPPPPSRQPPSVRPAELGEAHSSALALPSSPSAPTTTLSPAAPSTSHPHPPPCSKSRDKSRQSKDRSIRKCRPRYQLDVAAYGIPKQCRQTRPSSYDPNSSLAVSVGEDAYFLRNNAMGVADGVGGWSRKCRSPNTPVDSPSALFARRLMHFCSAEIVAATPSSILSAASGFMPCTPFSPPQSSTPIDLDSDDLPLQEQLEDELEELEDGIDVLMILERAYQRTLGAHVAPVEVDPTPPPPISPPLEASTCQYPPPSNPTTTTVPLLSGSSTVLLAVLDHVPKEDQDTTESELTTTEGHVQLDLEQQNEYEAVIRVAHVGDCMGMLVRGEQVVWRSEEMWWSFNTPVQLGPSSPATPLSSAHLFTLPVQEGDVLILASDGLSDNLWDEDVVQVIKGVRSGWEHTDTTPDTKLLAAQLSEALCSRARRVSERRENRVVVGKAEAMRRLGIVPSAIAQATVGAFKLPGCSFSAAATLEDRVEIEDEVPFARRAREAGKMFKGGKADDISVIVAVITPVAESRGSE